MHSFCKCMNTSYLLCPIICAVYTLQHLLHCGKYNSPGSYHQQESHSMQEAEITGGTFIHTSIHKRGRQTPDSKMRWY